MLCKEEKSSPSTRSATCDVPISTKRRIQGGQEFESLRARFEACDAPFAITAKAPQWRRRQRARIPVEPKLFPARRQ